MCENRLKRDLMVLRLCRNQKNVMNISQVIKLLVLGITYSCLFSNNEGELYVCDFEVIIFQVYLFGVGLYLVRTLGGSTSTLEPEMFCVCVESCVCHI
jgi:hypothetical protein